jgi:hypothetical protein
LRGKAEPPKDAKAEKESAPPMNLATPMIGGNANTAESGRRISAVEQSKNLAKMKSSDAADKSGVAGSLQNERDREQRQSLQAQASGAATAAPAVPASSPPPPPAVAIGCSSK